MPKQSKNLSLDPEAVRRGERYSELHRTNVSQIVNNFLAALPLEGDARERPLPAVVGRLLGSAADGGDVEDYHRYLVEKYGR